ncbi:hypothetical protein TWF481_001914 [Arthrobotrys musiformis]|uniref:Uncharacterized protein n=1 Tax=Arthrobotrys musiformis TaxID=47236 RepID=A0AAV9VVR7_9PEZI
MKPAVKPDPLVPKSHMAATAQLAALETRPPRIRPALPTLPPLPISKSGKDPLLEAGFLWARYPECHRTAELLYKPLWQSLATFCPEVDWSKLIQWINHYKLRRRSRDYNSYLRAEDIESFIDYMLKYHPVDKLGDVAKTLDANSLEKDLVVYFSKWDAILVKERMKRETARFAQRQPSGSTSSVTTLAPPPQAPTQSGPGDLPSKSPLPTSIRTPPECNSEATSPDNATKKDNGFQLPKRHRLVITKIVEDAVERTTRAMLAIYTTMHGENRSPSPNGYEPDLQEQPTLISANPQQQSPANREEYSRVPSVENMGNKIDTPIMPNVDLNPTKSVYSSPSTETPETDNGSPPNKPLSPQEKEAMKKYLLAHDLLKRQDKAAGQSVDGPYSISLAFRKRVSEAKRAHSAFGFRPRMAAEAVDPIYSPPIWQPKPVSPHTQAKIYSMHQYYVPSDGFGGSFGTDQPAYEAHSPYATFPRSAGVAYPSFPIMNYVWDHAVPIGPDTTPHIAMFANHRREREREDTDTMLRNFF